MVISGPLNGSKRRSAPLFIINKEMVICQLQYYHALSDICCPGNSRYGSPWCPVLRGEQFLEAHVAITNTSRVADQVHALNCAVLDPFLQFFPFDSLGCVPENPCRDIRGVPITECLVCRGTSVCTYFLQDKCSFLLFLL